MTSEEKLLELKRQYQESGQELLKSILKEVFDSSEELSAIVWTQSSPYFNDGEECIFSVDTPIFTNAAEDDIDDIRGEEYEGDRDDIWTLSFSNWSDRIYYSGEENLYPTINLEKCRELSKLLDNSKFADIWKEMLGNHVRVVATREGLTIEGYEHD